MFRSFAALFSLVVILCGPAFAASPLTDDQVSRFVKTLDPVQEMGDRLEAEGKKDLMYAKKQPALGKEFKPYSNGVADLKTELPGEHKRLAALLKPHGFSTDEWAGVGDRVMAAYLAVRMEEEDPDAMKQMEEMDPSMLDMMPPQMRTQLESAIAMVQAIRDVPAADKKAVMASKKELDAYMDRSSR